MTAPMHALVDAIALGIAYALAGVLWGLAIAAVIRARRGDWN